jgi:hypothetical protein
VLMTVVLETEFIETRVKTESASTTLLTFLAGFICGFAYIYRRVMSV